MFVLVVDVHVVVAVGHEGKAVESGTEVGTSKSIMLNASYTFGIRQSAYPPREAVFAAAQ